jgi:signal transduction histidine kinase
MLQEGNLRPIDQNRLKIIESQLDQLADAFRNLLAYTHQPKPQLKPLNVNEVLKELIPLGEPWLRARNITLHSSLNSNLPMVLGDPTHLQTLFLNLLTNALDAMPNGGTLTITTQPTTPPSSSRNGQWVEISISDTGVGISEELKKRIFDPFFTTKNIGEGMGLGLSICEKIVKDHSGRLEVRSEVGKGSTFSVYIPIYHEREDHE